MAGALSRTKRFDDGGPVYDDNYNFGNSPQNDDDSNDDAEGALASAGKNLIGKPDDVAGAFTRAQATRDAATQRQLQLLRTARSRLPPASGGGLNPQLSAAIALLSTPGNFGQGLGGAFAAYGAAQDRDQQEALKRARELGQYDLAEGEIGTKGADADYNILKERFGLGERAANAAAIIKQRRQAALDRAQATRDAAEQRAAATRDTNARIAADAAARNDILRSNEPLVQIVGDDDKPTWVRRSDALGKQAYVKPTASTTRISALAQLTKDHDNGLVSDEDFDNGRKKLTHFSDNDKLVMTTGDDGRPVWTKASDAAGSGAYVKPPAASDRLVPVQRGGKTVYVKSSEAAGEEVGSRAGSGSSSSTAFIRDVEYVKKTRGLSDADAQDYVKQSATSAIAYSNSIQRAKDRLAKTGKGDADTFIPYTPQELDQLAKEEARQIRDEAIRHTAPPKPFDKPFAGQDTRDIAGAAGATPTPAPALSMKRTTTTDFVPTPAPAPTAIPPRPAGVPTGAKYSPSQKKWWWQQDGKWVSG